MLASAAWTFSIGCGDDGKSGREVEALEAPALFRVGASVASLDPTVPVYSGGFGLSPAITVVHDPLTVRAFYVSNGSKALALAVADSQGWFASFRDAPGLGITGTRIQAAAEISALGGPELTEADIIIQASHSHSAPTVEGIWGPVPLEYLRLLHDRTVEALVAAARDARPAWLQWGTVDAPFLNNIDTAQTDSYPGWSQDSQVSVLRAVSPDDGATLMTFVNIPAHPDIVCGACLGLLGSDYFGPVRNALEEALGGVAIVGPATLGREESPVQTRGLEEMSWYAGVVASLVFEALAGPEWVDDPTLASSEVLTHTVATNPALLVLNRAWALPPWLREILASALGMYPTNRSMDPPYLDGRLGGTWLTAHRIGRLIYLSMPGEPFPEVRAAIASRTNGADMIVGLSKGQDDLGYFFPEWVYPFTFLYPSDHWEFNVSTSLGDVVVADHIENIRALGFDTESASDTHLPTRWEQAFHPGLQALASPMQGDASPDGALSVQLQAIYEPAAFGGHDIAGEVEWIFDDGPPETWPPGVIFTRAFGVGEHDIRLSATDSAGQTAEWLLTVRVYPPLDAWIETEPLGDGVVRFTGRAEGGQGTVLAWRWSFGDGETASGQTVVHRYLAGHPPSATLKVTDASGTVVTASFPTP